MPSSPPVALLLTRFITDRPEMAAAMARGIAGPTTWPTVMLYAVSALRAGLGGAAHGGGPAATPSVREEALEFGDVAERKTGGLRVWVGIGLVLAYGFVAGLAGFCTRHGAVHRAVAAARRHPLAQADRRGQLIGTVALLYLFIKLALMPLDRGAGVIGEFSVWLYRLLGIY
jgi:putative tricarboxylic transport membrane protein